ncbi:hypothetical protein SAMN05660209_01279 [Geodermatophilus africanus]|uniref:Uncharacterized protein n=1 Tax=Geodermatophilus africanus TaxID=1137993 RepID=A0A1H3EMG9_9ACTN|nr:hypothetical protein [Geodermatophilus africanus]SDX79767.1 hypothetical protein SAMN05660209_01279 [Geodermatophilus africanus]
MADTAADASVEQAREASGNRDRMGRALLWLLGAVASTVSALSSVVAADDPTRVVELWRM